MRIMKEAHDRAEKTVKTHMKLLEQIAQKLITEETIERDEFEKILILNGIKPKREEAIIPDASSVGQETQINADKKSQMYADEK